MMENRKLVHRADLIIISLLVLAMAVYIRRGVEKAPDTLVCEISLNGTAVITMDLSSNQIFSLEEKPNVVFEVKNNAIAFVKSDCPDRVCINSGYLRYSGQMAACLPNMISIKISSRHDGNTFDEPDMIAY